MRSFQVFAAMPAEQSHAFMKALAETSPVVFSQALYAASAALKARPVYLKRQPFEKRAEAVRRALSRVTAEAVASELLAVYFLECRKPLLLEWLDGLGIAHDDGTLSDDAPAEPKEADLHKAVESFLGVDDDPDRRLLLSAFAAQDAIEWPGLEALVDTPSA